MIKLSLNAEEILKQKFKPVARGYDPFMVDVYFDHMIEDYRTVEANVLLSVNEHEELLKRIKNLEEKIKKLELENTQYKQRLSNIKDSDAVTEDNVEMIRKINAYEKFLWKNGFDPNKIK